MPSEHLLGRELIRWGILGCGDVTEVKSGPGFRKAERSQLVAVMRRNGALAEDYAMRHGVARWYDDASQLINDDEVDAVYVATPPDSHADFTIAALEAGKPVYVEKPMGRNTAECDHMLGAAARADQKLFVAYYRRTLPRFQVALKVIREGRLGTITGVRWRCMQPAHRKDPAAWRVNPAVAGGGLFVDLASHVLDVFDYIFGPLHSAAGTAANLASQSKAEDSVTMSFMAGFNPGIPGSISCNFASDLREDCIDIVGTEACLQLSAFGNEPIRIRSQDKDPETLDAPNPPHVAQPLIQTVVDDLLGRGTCPSTGESARRASQLIDQVLAPYYDGRDDDFWTRIQ